MKKRYELCLRLTEAEKARLDHDCKVCGLSRSVYLRRLIMGSKIQAKPSEELKKLRTEVHHIGNNINQIARSANAGFAKPEDIRQALFLMDKVYTLFYDYFHS